MDSKFLHKFFKDSEGHYCAKPLASRGSQSHMAEASAWKFRNFEYLLKYSTT